MAGPLDELAKIVSTCTSCRLHRERKNAVFGRGNPTAPLMIIGEAPGQDEDEQGLPFVGRSGQFLMALLRAALIPEDQVYVTNVLKCRPPKNKFPEGDEPEICRKYLLSQIKEVKPQAILLAGKQAIKYVLLHGTSEQPDPIVAWINKFFRRRDLFDDVKFACVYHPAYMLRTGIEEDQEAWIQAAAQLWAYVDHKLRGEAPAPLPFTDLRSPPIPPRMGRNLFGRDHRKVL